MNLQGVFDRLVEMESETITSEMAANGATGGYLRKRAVLKVLHRGYCAALCEVYSPELLAVGQRHPYFAKLKQLPSSNELLRFFSGKLMLNSAHLDVSGRWVHDYFEQRSECRFTMTIGFRVAEVGEFCGPVVHSPDEQPWLRGFIRRLRAIYRELFAGADPSDHRMATTELLFRHGPVPYPGDQGDRVIYAEEALPDGAGEQWLRIKREEYLPELFSHCYGAMLRSGGEAGVMLAGLQVGIPVERAIAPLWVRQQWPNLMQ